MQHTQTQPFERPRTGRVITGVTTALASRTEIDRGWIRIAFVLATFAGGFGLVAYALATIAIRSEGETDNTFQKWILRYDECDSTGQKAGWWVLTTMMLVGVAAISFLQGPFVLIGLIGLGAWLLVRPQPVIITERTVA